LNTFDAIFSGYPAHISEVGCFYAQIRKTLTNIHQSTLKDSVLQSQTTVYKGGAPL